MDSITLFVLALGLSMDAFAVSISNSMCFPACGGTRPPSRRCPSACFRA